MQIVKLDNGIVIQKIRIIGTKTDVYSAWEPTNMFPDCQPSESHSTITSYGPKDHEDFQKETWYGKVGTRLLTAELAALPALSGERFSAVMAYHQEQYTRAIELILAAFPEAAEGRQYMGVITLTVDE